VENLVKVFHQFFLPPYYPAKENIALSIPGNHRKLKFEGGNIGQLISSVNSPQFGHIDLAVVRRPCQEIGTSVEIYDGHSETVIPARVVALPFE